MHCHELTQNSKTTLAILKMVAERKYTCSNTKLHKVSSLQSPNKQKDSAIKLLRTHDKQD